MDLAKVNKLIAEDASLLALRGEVERNLTGEVDAGHDLSHMLRVAVWTIRLHPSSSSPSILRNCIAAALLHDFVSPPKSDVAKNKLASQHSADKARELLLSHSHSVFSPADVDDVCQAILDHSFSRGAVPQSDLGRALQDADRLEALGVLGAFRNIACGTRMHASFFHGEDPWRSSSSSSSSNSSRRELDDKRYSMDHYACKLFKLEHMMNTELGRQEAHKRTLRMRRLLQELGEEIGFDYTE